MWFGWSLTAPGTTGGAADTIFAPGVVVVVRSGETESGGLDLERRSCRCRCDDRTDDGRATGPAAEEGTTALPLFSPAAALGEGAVVLRSGMCMDSERDVRLAGRTCADEREVDREVRAAAASLFGCGGDGDAAAAVAAVVVVVAPLFFRVGAMRLSSQPPFKSPLSGRLESLVKDVSGFVWLLLRGGVSENEGRRTRRNWTASRRSDGGGVWTRLKKDGVFLSASRWSFDSVDACRVSGRGVSSLLLRLVLRSEPAECRI